MDIIRAWKDEEYRMSLSASEKLALPPNPAGLIELGHADLGPEPHLSVMHSPLRLSGQIELRGVSFCSRPESPFLLHDISLTIAPRQKVIIVGEDGSANRALARLCLGLYKPGNGDILYDGIPWQYLNPHMLRAQCVMVQQMPFLFTGSIRQNIAFNTPDLSLDQVQSAAEVAAIHNFIMQMPLGYETILQRGGTTLTSGQRQQLALARGIARQPAVLFLDEATCDLDVETERLVDSNLTQLGCTYIVIAKRLSSTSDADLVVILDKGKIIECLSRHKEFVHS